MKNDSGTSELSLAPQDSTALVPLNPAQLMQAIIDKGITPESVGVMKELIAMKEHLDDKQAERDFAKAFNALQAEMPNIAASKAVPNNDGSTRYTFAPFEKIMEAVRPLLLKHGFTVSFSMTFAEGRIIQTCTLQHTGGHSRTNSFAVRIGKGPPGSSEAQGDGAASTYAKRFALCNALNIVIEQDTDGAPDAKLEGEVISPEQIAYLKETLKESGFNEHTFWKLAGVEAGQYTSIRQGTYPVLSRAMEMKKNAKPT